MFGVERPSLCYGANAQSRKGIIEGLFNLTSPLGRCSVIEVCLVAPGGVYDPERGESMLGAADLEEMYHGLVSAILIRRLNIHIHCRFDAVAVLHERAGYKYSQDLFVPCFHRVHCCSGEACFPSLEGVFSDIISRGATFPEKDNSL